MLLELTCGFLMATAGLLLGWLGGMVTAVLWVISCLLYGFMARPKRIEQAGVTLIEVLIAGALLVGVAIPMLNFAAFTLGGRALERQLAVRVAMRTLEEIGGQAYRSDEGIWDPALTAIYPVGRYRFNRTWVIDPFTPPDSGTEFFWQNEQDQLRQVTVTVTCLNCTRPMDPVRMVTTIAKMEQ